MSHAVAHHIDKNNLMFIKTGSIVSEIMMISCIQKLTLNAGLGSESQTSILPFIKHLANSHIFEVATSGFILLSQHDVPVCEFTVF